jgi:hypothetical protein
MAKNTEVNHSDSLWRTTGRMVKYYWFWGIEACWAAKVQNKDSRKEERCSSLFI